jgi:uncharacterized membrane protein YqjE
MLLDSLKGLGSSLVDMIKTKIEIFSLDLKVDRIHFVRILVAGASGLFMVALGVVVGVFWLVQAFREADRFLVMGIIALSFLLIGSLVLAILARRLGKLPGPFAGTLAEFEKDREAFVGKQIEDRR